MVDLVEGFSTRVRPRNLVDFFARKFGTSYNQIVRCGELDQSTTIIITVLMQTVTASVLAVHWLPTDFCVEVPQDDYEVMPGASIYNSSEAAVKKVLLLFLFVFGRGVNVYEAYIKEFASVLRLRQKQAHPALQKFRNSRGPNVYPSGVIVNFYTCSIL